MSSSLTVLSGVSATTFHFSNFPLYRFYAASRPFYGCISIVIRIIFSATKINHKLSIDRRTLWSRGRQPPYRLHFVNRFVFG